MEPPMRERAPRVADDGGLFLHFAQIVATICPTPTSVYHARLMALQTLDAFD